MNLQRVISSTTLPHLGEETLIRVLDEKQAMKVEDDADIDNTPKQIELLQLKIAKLESAQQLLESTENENKALRKDNDAKIEQRTCLRSQLARAVEKIDVYKTDFKAVRSKVKLLEETLSDAKSNLRFQDIVLSRQKAELSQSQEELAESRETIDGYRRNEIERKTKKQDLVAFLKSIGVEKNDFDLDSGTKPN